jgi:hypothetical protein
LVNWGKIVNRQTNFLLGSASGRKVPDRKGGEEMERERKETERGEVTYIQRERLIERQKEKEKEKERERERERDRDREREIEKERERQRKREGGDRERER